MRLTKLIAVAGMCTAAAACDPCAGTPSCEAPRFQYLGEVVHYQTGIPVEGVEIAFEPIGADVAAATATSDRTGSFLFSFPAGSERSIEGRLRMVTPPGVEHVLEDVHLTAVRYRGDARRLPRLTTEPIFDRIWDIRRRGTAGDFARGRAEFVRTAGMQADRDSISAPISPTGHWRLSLVSPEQGTVIGELRVWSESGEHYSRTLAVQVDVWSPILYLGPLYIGPWLGFGARIVRESGDPVGNATVLLRRTGGVPTARPEHVVTTDANGGFPFDTFIVLEPGTLELDILVVPDGGPELRAEGVQVRAEERDDYYYFGEIVVR